MAPRTRTADKIAGDGASAPVAQKNFLLSRLPNSERAALLRNAEIIKPTLREVLSDIGDPIDRVTFPISGLISIVHQLKDQTTLEAMTVGREGFDGLDLFHRVKARPMRHMCQIEGEFISVPAKSFNEVLANGEVFSTLVHRYAQFATEILTQSAACNAMHMIEQRCARWLLTSSDGIGRTAFNLTQEFLSQMLAVRRPGVTVAMGALERLGVITHRYGTIKIVDVEGLKKAACECYETITNRQRELFEH
ncbi:MAG: Crp/Fnr family transcriptional regulator [Gemmatimonadaceae bacterium]